MKKTLFKSVLCATLFVGALTSCNDVEDLYNPELVREQAKKALGLDIAADQDWNMTSVVTANVTLNEDALSDYSFRIYSADPLDKNSGATILADYPVKTDAQGKASATFKFEAPSYLKYVYVARVDNHGRRWVGVSKIQNGAISESFGVSTSTSTRAIDDIDLPTMDLPYGGSIDVDLSKAYDVTLGLNNGFAQMYSQAGTTIGKIENTTYTQSINLQAYHWNDLGRKPNLGEYKLIIANKGIWQIPGDISIEGVDIIVGNGGTLKFTGKIQLGVSSRIIVMAGGCIDCGDASNAKIYCDQKENLIYNAGTIDTNIIELSNGAQLYNANENSTIIVDAIKSSGGGEQIGFDQTTNSPILREEKIINWGKIEAGEITSNGMQGELYNGCLIHADYIKVKRLSLNASSTIEDVITISSDEYYLRENSIVRATTVKTFNNILSINFIGDKGHALMSANTIDLSGNDIQIESINEKIFIEREKIIMNSGAIEKDTEWIQGELDNKNFKFFNIKSAPIAIPPSTNGCSGKGNTPTPNEPEVNKPTIFTYAFEDMNKEGGDYDMNDVVLRCKKLDNNRISIELVAAGATKRIYAFFKDKRTNKEPQNLFGEIHEAFGYNSSIFINTGVGEDDVETKEVIIEDIEEGFLFSEHGDLYITDDYNREAHIPTFTEGFTPGDAPYAFCVPTAWRYPQEWQSVDIVYANFANWAENALEDIDWYTTEINESKVY